ncbi:MAG: diguanylate cyclase [Proteobacteria bacterium]|nr:diguanylate cyclase [Pseudomonadota bacterium]MBU1710382.1 diguanylate cyclase [Pseudomonadota bacterium]
MPRILVAGQETLLTLPFRELLQIHGYEIVVCSRLTDAVAIILDDPPDFLIIEKGFDLNGDVGLIKASKACLQKANMPILLILDEDLVSTLDWNLYLIDDIIIRPYSPELLLARVHLAESRMNRVFDNNPLTRLPGNTSILKAIQKVLGRDSCFAVCYVDIDNFKPYNDRYGFSRGDEVIIMTGRIIVNVIEEMSRDGSFVGHIGGDDFVFILREEHVISVCEKILVNFELVKNMFLSAVDIKAGSFVGKDRKGNENNFDLLSLSIGVIITEPGKYSHYGEVTEAASQMKSYVKKRSGSNFFIDRREIL